MSESKEKQPLIYMDMEESSADIKNTAPAEVKEIVKYAMQNGAEMQVVAITGKIFCSLTIFSFSPRYFTKA